MKKNYPKPDNRPNHKKAPKKRKNLKLADGVGVTLHPARDKFRGIDPPGMPWVT